MPFCTKLSLHEWASQYYLDYLTALEAIKVNVIYVEVNEEYSDGEDGLTPST